jgi:hypothetical protein
MDKALLSFFDIRENDNLLEIIANDLSYSKYIYTTRIASQFRTYYKNNNSFIIIPEIPSLENVCQYPSSGIIDLLSSHKEYIQKVILRFHTFRRSGFKNQVYKLDSLYYKYLFYVEKIIKDHNISLIIFGEPPHLPLEYIFHLLVDVNLLNGIYFNYINQLSLIKNYYFITDKFDTYTKEQHTYIKKIKTLSSDELFAMLVEPFNQIYTKKIQPKKLFKATDKFSYRDWSYYVSKFKLNKNKLQLLLNFIQSRSINIFNIISNRIILDKNISKKYINDVLGKNYIYFPLHFQPEATTLPHGRMYDNQLLAVDFLLNNLDKSISIVIKDHPAYYMYTKTESIKDYRNSNFYDYIKLNDRIILLNHDEDSTSLIKNSLCVATITGTVTFEALLENKNSILFGNSIYSELPNVLNPIRDINKIKNLKRDIEENFYESTLNKELLVYLNMLQKFSSNYSLPRSFYNKKDLIDLNPNFEELINKVISYVKKQS